MNRFLSALFAPLVLCSCLHQPSFDEGAWRKTVSAEEPAALHAPHERGGRYFNPWLTEEERGLKDLIRWRFSRKEEFTAFEQSHLPRVIPDLKKRIEAYHGDFVAWIGHATFLIRVNNDYWVTDPVFSERALLPKRKTPPGLTLEEILQLAPRLNVLISHNHYDHLDASFISRLPTTATVIVPPGLGAYVRSLGKASVVELDWWKSIDCAGPVRVVSLPAQHWSRRIGQAVNSSLWASYLLVTPGASVYFSGDSGYFAGYREIGRAFPGIDYALMPTTAYLPRWFMHYSHMDVNEAIDAFQDLGARSFIPIEWGTFALGDEPAGYPVIDLQRQIVSRRLDASRFIVMDIGSIQRLERRR